MPGKYLRDSAGQGAGARKWINGRTIGTLMQWLIWLLVAAVLLLNLFTHVLQIVHYNGDGMEPSLHNGQILVLQKTKEAKSGDIIAFYYNNQILVRRVICTGGDRITVGNDGVVLINDEPLEEPYVEQPSLGQCSISFPYYVQTGYVFVMGDNREASMDSRLEEIGPIPAGRIIGKVIIRF